ncbi:hypothetical protein BU26DRAFT_513080 [Trematosphaeria pertusa]|uniref:Integral membrane protein n=1 Tax=Trematosphaeria pertusa TaxID=390896 RepID=A0A6A6J437_9PLEO|nr:uncharacterized protein BU26DRAFT_513080 [Trematosphaeria pertusa]KAF2256243.1 hypothetical protein BU26DRAFT_513080 [Trematosphaeria pertusa]
MRIFNRRRRSNDASSTTSPTVTPDLSKAQLKRATRTRKIFALLTSFFLFLTVIFLILVELGGTYNKPAIKNWYFLKIDVSHIIPASVPNFSLINTIAQTLGLHDFYQVGLWGFCEGYLNEGVTYCSPPKTLYWFNPIQILSNELLAGASINLPANINDILDLIKLVSQVMFGLFLTSACLSFILMFLMPISVFSRWWTLPIAILALLNAIFVTVASVIATVMFVIFRNVIAGVAEINISAKIGSYLFGFMWTASAFAIFACLIQTGLCCCCASRRDVRTGRKKGNEKAYHTNGRDGVVANGEANGVQEKSAGRRRFRFGKRSV